MSATQQAFRLWGGVSVSCFPPPGNTYLLSPTVVPQPLARPLDDDSFTTDHIRGWIRGGHPECFYNWQDFDTHRRPPTQLSLSIFSFRFFLGQRIRGMQQCTMLGHGPRQKSLWTLDSPIVLFPSFSSLLNTARRGFLLEDSHTLGRGPLDDHDHDNRFFPWLRSLYE